MPTEENRQLALAAARQASETANDNEGVAGPTEPENAANHPWLIMFLAVSLLWLLGVLLSFIILPFVWVMNFLAVLALWLWAKSKKLKPPTFRKVNLKDLVKTATSKDGKNEGSPAEAASAVSEPPASDLVYILSGGGISPLIYLTALWWNNR